VSGEASESREAPAPTSRSGRDASPSSASNPAGAVFLSYASEDADAAERISNSLRSAGIEVWFDRNELRGGDVWDRQIRKQIHDCTLFVPVISAHSDARQEGYFRREWRLAVERAGDMAEDVPFLVPVVIDNTPDATARVPDRFREVQWTRLPVGEASPAFIERVQRLLFPAQGHASATPVATATSADGAPRAEAPGESLWVRLRRQRVVEWTLGYVAFAYATLNGVVMLRETFDWPALVPRLANHRRPPGSAGEAAEV
jgi:hypothetical protein